MNEIGDDGTNFYGGERTPVKRTWRTSIPDKLDVSINLWSILSKCIEMDLTRISFPVNYSEPISLLQRITEQLEYSQLLDQAASHSKNPIMEMAYLCALIVSAYSTTKHRFGKPFNPMLGETYELDLLHEQGWRTIAEQVSHHPPTMAQHTQSTDWLYYHDLTVSNKFRGKYIKTVPSGKITHFSSPGVCVVKFRESGNTYSWQRLPIFVNNVVIGKLWVENRGDIHVLNHTTGHYCTLKFHSTAYFSFQINRTVTGDIKDSEGKNCLGLRGEWHSHMDMIESNGQSKRLWTAEKYPDENEEKYRFSTFAMQLNAEEDFVAPTDSRLRPDQRSMEEGNWDFANHLKVNLEEKQRSKRKNLNGEKSGPLWFKFIKDEVTGQFMYRYVGGYWTCKNKRDWSLCPDIFL